MIRFLSWVDFWRWGFMLEESWPWRWVHGDAIIRKHLMN